MRYLISFDTNLISQEQASDWGIDKVLALGFDIKSDLSGLPQDKESLTIFIPTVFDYSNSLSYAGANLGLRILMSYLRDGRSDVEIELMGNEAKENFLLHYDYPNILKIPGINYIRFNKNIVASYKAPCRELMKASEYMPCLKNLGLKLPSSFKSTHSLTNEWCLYKWNSFMGFKEDSSSLVGRLYFDYLITLEILNRVKSKTASENLNERIKKLRSSRILLIDDNVGWHGFFKEFFKDSEIQLEAIGEDFKKMGYEDVLRIITDKVDSFAPDVILLDFRLLEDKDADSDFKEISGTKILKALKGKFDAPGNSYGRQILIFTATSRIENILRLKGLNADGFILKEKPEYYASKEMTKDSISHMVRDITEAVERAKFLIPLNEGLATLANSKISEELEAIKLQEYIKTVVESVRLVTQNNNLDEGVLKLVYLNLFAILEFLKPSSYKYINDFVQSTAPNDILSLWNNIDSLRNSLAHGDKLVQISSRKEQISATLIQNWTLNLCYFIKEYIERHR